MISQLSTQMNDERAARLALKETVRQQAEQMAPMQKAWADMQASQPPNTCSEFNPQGRDDFADDGHGFGGGSFICPIGPTSTVTSSSNNDIHVSAIISKDSNDILEPSITSTILIEPPDGPNSTPHVEQHSVPSRFFGTLEEAISFYGVYAEACGFEPMKSSQKRYVSGDVQYKFFVCNREGFRDRKRKAIVLHSGEEQATPKPFDITNTKLTRIGCTAMIEFRFNGDGYVVFQFHEWHNHRLCSLRNQKFQKKHRHLHLYHKKTIIDHSRVNQGPTTAFRNVKKYVDGYENVGAQLVDFKNFGRDIKCFIGNRDAQLFVNHFEDKRDTNEGFYFAYEADFGECLVRAFWCDAESRRNYALFGDYITYDPTYNTNKYCMVFTPFTGVDQHNRSVTFAGALLFHEDEDSFKWLFEKFLDAMVQREPHCIISDQCAGIKKGLRAVFKHARRRYCMWHIMLKLTDKVGPAISKETDFVSRLNAIVWDAKLEPSEFEEKWSQLVNEYNLEGNSWLSTMFRKRRKWIPAIFRDIPMGCLLRTTQRSESQNSFFKRFENVHGTLVELWMRFQSAIDVQRHTQKQLDRDDDCTLPQLSTSVKLEAHASKVYTNSAFADFQLEAKATICSLSVGGFTPPVNGIKIIVVADARTQKTYQETSSHFATDLRKLEMCKLWSMFYVTISVLKNVPTNDIIDLVYTLKQFRVKLNPQSESMTKEQELEMLLGCSSSTEVRILPPRQAKNKGSGKRMISKKQQCIAKAESPKRLCRNCKQMAHHDKRNCPNAFVPDADNKGSSDEDDADDG
ncbi:protein FAR1-RELATED SEQUENCE 5-like [Silene latifolia]|uniref:protein FAR1-RELATED SEQUENCE 5-like n=1 Tax=Silene latifolia TaxID=37657 RepID=UPI003D76F9AB